MTQPKVLIATWPFGSTGRKPLELLEKTGWEIHENPFQRRLKSNEVASSIEGVHAVIAGTEPYNTETLVKAKDLKVIARVGIGLDNIDLDYCEKNGIKVTYTPDAPSQAVAEMTVAFIISLMRMIHVSDTSVRAGAWNRMMGKLVSEVKIGIIGMGRIGRIVTKLLEPFNPTILATDINPEVHGTDIPNVQWVSLDEILRESDVLSVHIPMCDQNKHFINRDMLTMMKTDALFINTARGGVVNEKALEDALLQHHLGGAALDVFETEPYEGPLTNMDNVILSAHMGASAVGSRYLMELGAIEDLIRVLNGQEPEFDAIADMKKMNEIFNNARIV